MFKQILAETSCRCRAPLIALVTVVVLQPSTLFASELSNETIEGGASVELFELESNTIGANVSMSALLPPGFDRESDASLPLVIWLHGGGGDRQQLVQTKRYIDEFFGDSVIPPMVFVSFSTSPFSGFLGSWETFIESELPEAMASRYNTRTDREGVMIGGISMGGYGSLKSAFRNPTRFLAVGAMEPSIEPTLSELPNFTRNTWTRGPAPSLSVSDNPVRLAHDNAETIRESGLNIYLECGDEDYLNLHDGTEFLHRVLWDKDIRHEYHLVRWADHVGVTMQRRMKEMFAFFAQSLAGGRSDPVALPINEKEQQLLDLVAERAAAGESPPPEFSEYLSSVRGATLHAHAWNSLKELAAADPAMKRNYAELPTTSLPEDAERPSVD
ncbi:MAG: alpha/beta hydrolase-fold protein [Gammaproteobacteria bacterium]|nr:alpha/beta hydrolase-fold protein [Gammaproteobacteria bacterium]